MPDWTRSMQQTFEYYVVDPITWKDMKKIENVKSCSIDRDSDSDTLGTASFDVEKSIGECYIRIYLVTIQNGVTEKHPLGTFLTQTPSTKNDGKAQTITVDAYSPLLELKENPPPIGYSVLKGANIMDTVYTITKEHVRAPVVMPKCEDALYYDFVANTSDTWSSFVSDLMSNAKYSFDLDEMSRILFSPKQDTASLQHVWVYDDDNSSILYPDVDLEHDIYGIPNVVEVIYSHGAGHHYSRAVNDNPNSPISTVNRGREITHRVMDPDLIGDPTENQIDEYAEQLLRDLSSLEYTVTYTHGYCPVRVGDCVLLNHSKARLNNVKAKVISQSIDCTPGCPVTETAVFNANLYDEEVASISIVDWLALVRFYINDSGHLIMSYNPLEPASFSIDANGHLKYEYTDVAPSLKIDANGHVIYTTDSDRG